MKWFFKCWQQYADFSIGKLFVGDLFFFQEYDTDTLIEYILRYSNCRKFNKFL